MDTSGNSVHIYVFSKPDAQQVFLNVTKVQSLDTFTFEQDDLPPFIKNIPLSLHVSDSNVMLYTCCIDEENQPGDTPKQRHDHVHELVAQLADAARKALPDVHSVQLLSNCGNMVQVTRVLYPIVLSEEEQKQLAEATGMATVEQEMARRNMRHARRQEAGAQRTRASVLRRRATDTREIDPMDDMTLQPPTQRQRVNGVTPPPYVNSIMGATLSALFGMGPNGAFEILGMDLSRPPPAEPLPEQPQEIKGTALGEAWEAQLKPEEELKKTEESDLQCQGCCTYVRTVITLPCKHQFYCDNCFRRHMSSDTLHKTCPECREPVTGIFRAFA